MNRRQMVDDTVRLYTKLFHFFVRHASFAVYTQRQGVSCGRAEHRARQLVIRSLNWGVLLVLTLT